MLFLRLLLAFLIGTSFCVHQAFAQSMEVAITQIDGSRIVAKLDSIGPDGGLQGQGIPSGLTLSDLLRIERTDETADSIDSSDFPITVELANGSRIAARHATLKSETVRFESRLDTLELPLQHFRALIWRPSPMIAEQLANPSGSEDHVIVETPEGDRIVSGLVEGLDELQLQIQYENELRKINISRLKGVVFANVAAQTDREELASVKLADGSLLKGGLPFLSEGTLGLNMLGSISISVPAKSFRELIVRSDRVQFLSDLEPVGVQQRSPFTLERGWQRDRSVEKNPLSLRDAGSGKVLKFDKGLGVQSFCQLDFANTNDFKRFQAVIGIDVETKGRGDCLMVVRGDGIELWSGRVRGTDSATPVDVDLSGVKIVSLIVHEGEMFDLADHANWCNARFTK